MTDETKPKSARKVLGRDDKKPLPKRFYKEVGLGATRSAEGGSAFAILLDGRPVKTPAKGELVLPSEALATAVAREWAAQVTHINPALMPLTKLCNTAIDRVRGREGIIADDIAAYAGSDLVCYRAESPPKLVAMQAAAWDPVLVWARHELSASFTLAQGLMPITQPAESAARVRVALAGFDCFALCALHNITTLTGSVLMALAHARGFRDLEVTWTAAHVDEDFQIEAWGVDAEAEARREHRWQDMQAAGALLVLARHHGHQ
jgi:chaperone required for assembly of F1-ATPase